MNGTADCRRTVSVAVHVAMLRWSAEAVRAAKQKKTQIGKAYAAEEKENLAGKQSVRQSNLVNERGIKKKKQKKERTEEKNKHK